MMGRWPAAPEAVPMPARIEPLQAEDLPALGRFLAEGFGGPADAEFVSEDVLRWKYLEPRPGRDGEPRSLVAWDDRGRIVGHVGFNLTTWRRAGSDREVSTLHLLDWLADPSHRGVGASLMRRAHARAETQYVLGGSGDARRVIARAGYERLEPVPVFRRVLRPGYRLREGGPLGGRLLRSARDAARLATDRPRSAGRASVVLRPVGAFGPEVEEVTSRCEGPLIYTGRHADDLNAALSYPRRGLEGGLVERAGGVVGFALWNVLARGRVRVGKVADLFLADRDPAGWRDAFAALAAVLRGRGADVALACGGPAWESEALREAGFRHVFDLDLRLRDRDGRLPRDVPRHLGFLEADYAYLP